VLPAGAVSVASVAAAVRADPFWPVIACDPRLVGDCVGAHELSAESVANQSEGTVKCAARFLSADRA